MAKPANEMTPMQRQYHAIKERNQDCILFFRLGDFYEMFDEDAKLAARELDLTLTTRDRGKPREEQTPMCGVPYHSVDSYIARLVQKGGLSYLEAFKLANMDRLMQQRAQVASTAARVATGGKNHLTKTKSVGTPPMDVPQDVKDAYRIFNPKATDEEIEKHYRKINKK